PEKVEDLIAEGARLVKSPADAAAEAEVFLLSLPSDSDVEEVVLGKQGLLDGARAGTVIVDTTSGTPKGAQQIAASARARGVEYLDAPISGGVKGAIEGTLTFIVGGEEEALEKARPLMNHLGSHIFLVGPPGAGRMLKAINQIISALNTLTLCETIVLARKAGISPQTFYDVLSKCAANSYHLQTKVGQFILPGKFEPGFRIELLLKDLEIALTAAREYETPMLLTGLASQTYRAAGSAGYAQKDISAAALFLGGLVGVSF
ncbi:MAG: NAD(P)-dependent oxidoreductase, partial [Nitrospinota bacterium]